MGHFCQCLVVMDSIARGVSRVRRSGMRDRSSMGASNRAARALERRRRVAGGATVQIRSDCQRRVVAIETMSTGYWE